MKLEIVIEVDVDPEPEDTEDSVVSFVDSLASEWVREDVVYAVRVVEEVKT